MDQKHKKIKNHEVFQTMVDRRMWLIPQQLQDNKKPRKLKEVQEGRQEYQEIILQHKDSRNSKQEPWPLGVDKLN